jgi:hypothetical protein
LTENGSGFASSGSFPEYSNPCPSDWERNEVHRILRINFRVITGDKSIQRPSVHPDLCHWLAKRRKHPATFPLDVRWWELSVAAHRKNPFIAFNTCGIIMICRRWMEAFLVSYISLHADTQFSPSIPPENTDGMVEKSFLVA